MSICRFVKRLKLVEEIQGKLFSQINIPTQFPAPPPSPQLKIKKKSIDWEVQELLKGCVQKQSLHTQAPIFQEPQTWAEKNLISTIETRLQNDDT